LDDRRALLGGIYATVLVCFWVFWVWLFYVFAWRIVGAIICVLLGGFLGICDAVFW
jgi:hypothetical protein